MISINKMIAHRRCWSGPNKRKKIPSVPTFFVSRLPLTESSHARRGRQGGRKLKNKIKIKKRLKEKRRNRKKRHSRHDMIFYL